MFITVVHSAWRTSVCVWSSPPTQHTLPSDPNNSRRRGDFRLCQALSISPALRFPEACGPRPSPDPPTRHCSPEPFHCRRHPRIAWLVWIEEDRAQRLDTPIFHPNMGGHGSLTGAESPNEARAHGTTRLPTGWLRSVRHTYPISSCVHSPSSRYAHD